MSSASFLYSRANLGKYKIFILILSKVAKRLKRLSMPGFKLKPLAFQFTGQLVGTQKVSEKLTRAGIATL